MPNRTHIAYADYRSTPIRAYLYEPARLNSEGTTDGAYERQGWACVRVSDGCKHCYAATLNRRLGTGLDFTVSAMGQVEVYLAEREMYRMLTFRPKATVPPVDDMIMLASGVGLVIPAEIRRKPPTYKNRRSRPAVVVCDMSDLFGEWVPDEWLDRLFAVFALRPDVDWLAQTKRPKEMRAYLGDPEAEDRIYQTAWEMRPGGVGARRSPEHPFDWRWPLPNVWLGTSVENQETADARIPELLATPAAVRFVSAEPLLAPVDLCIVPNRPLVPFGVGMSAHPSIDLCIVGGESGPGARPCDLAWLRSVVAQCRAAGVPVFVKQLGSAFRSQEHRLVGANRGSTAGLTDGFYVRLRDRKGGSPDEWPADLRVREMPGGAPSQSSRLG